MQKEEHDKEKKEAEEEKQHDRSLPLFLAITFPFALFFGYKVSRSLDKLDKLFDQVDKADKDNVNGVDDN